MRADPANDRPNCPRAGNLPWTAPGRRTIMLPDGRSTTGASSDEPRIDGRCFPAARARRVQRPSALQRGSAARWARRSPARGTGDRGPHGRRRRAGAPAGRRPARQRPARRRVRHGVRARPAPPAHRADLDGEPRRPAARDGRHGARRGRRHPPGVGRVRQAAHGALPGAGPAARRGAEGPHRAHDHHASRAGPGRGVHDRDGVGAGHRGGARRAGRARRRRPRRADQGADARPAARAPRRHRQLGRGHLAHGPSL